MGLRLFVLTRRSRWWGERFASAGGVCARKIAARHGAHDRKLSGERNDRADLRKLGGMARARAAEQSQTFGGGGQIGAAAHGAHDEVRQRDARVDIALRRALHARERGGGFHHTRGVLTARDEERRDRVGDIALQAHGARLGRAVDGLRPGARHALRIGAPVALDLLGRQQHLGAGVTPASRLKRQGRGVFVAREHGFDEPGARRHGGVG